MKVSWVPKPTATIPEEQELALAMHALAHPARVRLVRILLGKRACTVGELVEALPLAPSTVSQHLKVLTKAGLVHVEIEGQKRICRVRTHRLARLKKDISNL